jgi:mxaJ protein
MRAPANTARHVRRLALRLIGATALLAAACGGAAQPPLRVCADPNNLPFSNRARDGFENRIAELLAADRHATLEYTWWAQRRGFVRNTLAAGTCDVVIGVPKDSASMATTRPYYRSSYVFVSRRDRDLNLASFDDPRLPTLRIGVQMIGDDFANTPPAHALARRGMTRNVVGYMVYGDYGRPSPLSEIVSAVDRGEVDTAVVWGPAAGFFARHSDGRLVLSAVSPQRDSPSMPFAFEISMGVRRGEAALRTELDDFLMRRHVQIDAILDEYGIPRVEGL